MSKVLLELDLNVPEDLNLFTQYHSEFFGDKPTGKGKAKTQAKEEEPDEEEEGDEITPQDVKDACAELKELTSAKRVTEVLKEFDVKTPAAAAKSDDFEDIYEALMDAIEEEGGEEADDEDEGEEVTIDDVKKACQEFAKSEGKDELNEVLEEFGIKSVRSLNKLSEDELAELYEEVASE